MSQALKAEDLVHCPACGKPQDGPAADYVIPGRTGEESRASEDCLECYAQFSVHVTAAGDFVVESDSD